jgi:hypothetical protein
MVQAKAVAVPPATKDRLNSVQSLFHLKKQCKNQKKEFQHLINDPDKEDMPSLKARIRKLINEK